MWILLGSLTVVVRNGYSLGSVKKIDKGTPAIVSSTSFGLEKELFEGSVIAYLLMVSQTMLRTATERRLNGPQIR